MPVFLEREVRAPAHAWIQREFEQSRQPGNREGFQVSTVFFWQGGWGPENGLHATVTLVGSIAIGAREDQEEFHESEIASRDRDWDS